MEKHLTVEFVMASLFQEFRKFIQRGNVVDLAVGVIMGAAFGKIVNSLVSDVLMPPIGWVIGGVDFKELKWSLPEWKIAVPGGDQAGELVTLAAVDIKYGMFLQTTFDFLIVAACVFLVVKGMNHLQQKQEQAPAPPPVSPQEKLLAEIRDLLKTMAE